jgi:hypothetical protein
VPQEPTTVGEAKVTSALQTLGSLPWVTGDGQVSEQA